MQSSGQTFDYTPSYAEAYKVQDRSSKQEISSLHGPVRAVVILRGSNAEVGIQFVRPANSPPGPYTISALAPGSSAEKSGLIGIGDLLHACGDGVAGVNPNDMRLQPHTQVYMLSPDKVSHLLKGVSGSPAVLLVAPLITPVFDSNGNIIKVRRAKQQAAQDEIIHSTTHCGGVDSLSNPNGVRKTHELTEIAESIWNFVMPQPLLQNNLGLTKEVEDKHLRCTTLLQQVRNLQRDTNYLKKREESLLQSALAREEERLEWHKQDENPANSVTVMDSKGHDHVVPPSLAIHLQSVLVESPESLVPRERTSLVRGDTKSRLPLHNNLPNKNITRCVRERLYCLTQSPTSRT